MGVKDIVERFDIPKAEVDRFFRVVAKKPVSQLTADDIRRIEATPRHYIDIMWMKRDKGPSGSSTGPATGAKGRGAALKSKGAHVPGEFAQFAGRFGVPERQAWLFYQALTGASDWPRSFSRVMDMDPALVRQAAVWVLLPGSKRRQKMTEDLQEFASKIGVPREYHYVFLREALGKKFSKKPTSLARLRAMPPGQLEHLAQACRAVAGETSARERKPAANVTMKDFRHSVLDLANEDLLKHVADLGVPQRRANDFLEILLGPMYWKSPHSLDRLKAMNPAHVRGVARRLGAGGSALALQEEGARDAGAPAAAADEGQRLAEKMYTAPGSRARLEEVARPANARSLYDPEPLRRKASAPAATPHRERPINRVRTVRDRVGQPRFRDLLIRVWGGRCSFTGCDVVDALEAAHIVPYARSFRNVRTNGLLLRADVHRLFDAGRITVCPETLEIAVDDELRETSYGALHGQAIEVPAAVPLKGLRENLSTLQDGISNQHVEHPAPSPGM